MAPASVQAFPSALPFLPRRVSLATLRQAAAGCRGCPLYARATQTVFGRGRRDASLMLVGEQPGNEEDKQGEPFVGPAGRILRQGLEGAGIDPDDTYTTNVVKHFKWIAVHRRRMHKKPSAREIAACVPWLEKELELIKPRVLVCLGATAAQALLGPAFRVTRDRGRDVPSTLAPHAVATVHPSSILRQQTSEDRHRELDRFTDDLRVAARLLSS